MTAVSYSFLKSQLANIQSFKEDTHLHSSLYYRLTCRKGLSAWKSENSLLLTGLHPHIENRIMIFPELGSGDYALTASYLLDYPNHAGRKLQLARYTEHDLNKLKYQLQKKKSALPLEISIIPETVMDWYYPVHIIQTRAVSEMKGKDFAVIRNKYNKVPQTISYRSFINNSAIRLMRAVLKFWEGNMIFYQKETEDMHAFYEELFKIIEERSENVYGLIFLNNEKPVGFTVWDEPVQETSNILVNINDTSIRGLSEFQQIITCRMLAEQGIKYANIGGSELASLDAFKAKFQPVKTIPLLSAEVHYNRAENVNIQTYTIVEEARAA